MAELEEYVVGTRAAGFPTDRLGQVGTLVGTAEPMLSDFVQAFQSKIVEWTTIYQDWTGVAS